MGWKKYLLSLRCNSALPNGQRIGKTELGQMNTVCSNQKTEECLPTSYQDFSNFFLLTQPLS